MARDMFKSNAPAGKNCFQFDHVLDVMQNLEKFKDHNDPMHPRKISRKNFSTHVSSSSENATPDSPNLSSFNITLSDDNVDISSFDANENMGGSSHERPKGIKKSKAKKKFDNEHAAALARLEEKNEELLGVMKDNVATKERYLSLAEAKREDKIMAVDLNAITDPDSYAYYKMEKDKIMRKRMGHPTEDSSSGGLFSPFFNNLGGGGGSNLGDY